MLGMTAVADSYSSSAVGCPSLFSMSWQIKWRWGVSFSPLWRSSAASEPWSGSRPERAALSSRWPAPPACSRAPVLAMVEPPNLQRLLLTIDYRCAAAGGQGIGARSAGRTQPAGQSGSGAGRRGRRRRRALRLAEQVAAQPGAAVDDQAFAVDEGGVVGDQVGGGVGDLLGFAQAAGGHRGPHPRLGL